MKDGRTKLNSCHINIFWAHLADQVIIYNRKKTKYIILWNFGTHNHEKAIIQDNSNKYEISQFPCEDFPPDVCGGRRVELPHPASLTLTLIPADQGHVQSHLSTRNRNSYNPIFSSGQMHILCQMSQSHFRRNIFVCQTISHRDILDSKTCLKLSMTKTSVRYYWKILHRDQSLLGKLMQKTWFPNHKQSVVSIDT